MTSDPGYRELELDRLTPDGRREQVRRAIAIETPIAVEINGLGYAVMMASPVDLTDFAYGFALSERLIDGPDDVVAVDRHTTELGGILRPIGRASCRASVCT